LDDEVRQALMIMLERLRPAERVAFVLHDVFQVLSQKSPRSSANLPRPADSWPNAPARN
jgi:hypothetical protein